MRSRPRPLDRDKSRLRHTVRLQHDHLLAVRGRSSRSRSGPGPGPGPGPSPCDGNTPAALPLESTLPPILLPSAVAPSVALSGPDLLPGCVVAERALEFEGPAGASRWSNGATISFSVSSSSTGSECAMTKLLGVVRSEESEPVSS